MLCVCWEEGGCDVDGQYGKTCSVIPSVNAANKYTLLRRPMLEVSNQDTLLFRYRDVADLQYRRASFYFVPIVPDRSECPWKEQMYTRHWQTNTRGFALHFSFIEVAVRPLCYLFSYLAFEMANVQLYGRPSLPNMPVPCKPSLSFSAKTHTSCASSIGKQCLHWTDNIYLSPTFLLSY